MQHIFSIDVEDWYEGFSPSYTVPPPHIPRLEKGMRFLLDELERVNAKATFFWVGSQALRYPGLLRETASRGHEIGCHGFAHVPIYTFSPCEFKIDLQRALGVLREITGAQIRCYRAPFFSVRKDTLWALEILAASGIEFDSSILPMRHWRTGIAGADDCIHHISTGSGDLIEVPITVRPVFGMRIPTGGGGYFRAYPFALTASNITYCESQKKCNVFYAHPWEFDSTHPRLEGNGPMEMLHYHGLGTNRKKLSRLLERFSFGPLMKLAKENIRKEEDTFALTGKESERAAMEFKQ